MLAVQETREKTRTNRAPTKERTAILRILISWKGYETNEKKKIKIHIFQKVHKSLEKYEWVFLCKYLGDIFVNSLFTAYLSFDISSRFTCTDKIS